MKASSALFIVIVAAVVSSLAFFWTRKPVVARVLPPPQASAPGGTELQKTEASLKKIDEIRFADGLTPERLLPQRAEAGQGQGDAAAERLDDARVFPSLTQNQRIAGTTQNRGSGAGMGSAGSAARSGYENSIDGKPAAPSAEDKKTNVVSLTYVSPGFRRAVVDSELVREGKLLPDGAVVSRIRKGSVVLTRDWRSVEAPVPGLLPRNPEPVAASARPPATPVPSAAPAAPVRGVNRP
ncbi:MAG: hypothetical protein LBL72_00810 [Candidatus Accumulibacter sp.]|jgi:hypothetical protein|nr:hypothetical protein [Accumulibacter sp.]